VAGHVEVVLAAGDLVEVQLREQDRLLVEGRAASTFPSGSTMQLPPRMSSVSGESPGRWDVGRKVAPPQDLASAEHEAPALERHVGHVGSHVSRSSAVGAQ